jgi:hypothetical protein
VSPSLALFSALEGKYMSPKHRIVCLGLAVALLASPVRAGEADKYLPVDTEVYSVINIRQILGSALIKRIGVDKIKDLLQQAPGEVTDVLKDLGLDPFKDIDKLISAGPASGEQDKGLVIIHGRFDLDKFRTRADKEAKDNKEIVKSFKIAGQTCYEVVIADANLSVFVGFASKNTILVAMSKDYLGDALKVGADATKPKLKNKAFQEMLAKLDEKSSLATVVMGDVLTKGPLGDLPENVKELMAKVTAISGAITVTDGVKFEFSGGTKAAKDAQTIKDEITNGLNLVTGLAALAAMNMKELAPVIDFLKSIKVTAKDTTVSIKAEITGEDLNKVLPGKDQ